MSKILIVEGQEDENFFKQLLRNLNLQDVEVKSNPSGKGNAITTFASSIKLENRASNSRLGLVVDADFAINGGGSASTLNTINAIINSPFTQLTGGGLKTVIQSKPSLKAGLWIMPDNSNDGYIEHFLEGTFLSSENSRMQYAKQAVQSALTSANGFPVQPIHIGKANVGTYLAWQNPPRMSFANCLSKNLIDSNANSYVAIANWLCWLYT
jgi:hypothetical protein